MNIQEVINEVIFEEQSKPRESSGKFKPSLFGLCYRRQYWERLGEEKTNPIDERTRRVFKCGNLFEDFIIENLKKKYPHLETQVKVEQPDFFGYADIVEDDCVTDVKSQHSSAFWHMKRELDFGKSIVDIKINNFLQTGFYALHLGKPFVKICLVSKDDLMIAEYKAPLESVKIKLVLEEYCLCDFWEKKFLPRPEPRCFGIHTDKKYNKEWIGYPKECAFYCPFRNKCFHEQGKEIPCQVNLENPNQEAM